MKLPKQIKLSRLFFFDQWFLMFQIGDEISHSFWKFKKIIPPKDKFWADPFVIKKDNQYYIFLEEYVYKKRKAHIALMVMDEKGNYQKPIKILERPYHLSYPFVFRYQDSYYMIPETWNNNTIEVYKCIEFPLRWVFYKKLMENVHAVDSTLLFYKNKWWLFSAMKKSNQSDTCDELFLFYADNPLDSKWVPHPQNPLISDIRKARPGGRIYEYEGSLYRPSQDGSIRYGYGLVFNKITILNELEYKEETVKVVEPDWDKKILGLHTFCNENGLTVIDAILKRPGFLSHLHFN